MPRKRKRQLQKKVNLKVKKKIKLNKTNQMQNEQLDELENLTVSSETDPEFNHD